MTGHDPASAAERDPGAAGLRRILLLVVLLGMVGLEAELILLEHYEETWQWIPHVLLVAGFASGGWLWLRPAARSILTFRVLMGACVAAGLIGIYLHFQSNWLFELEMDGDASGLALVWLALRGATPALAPGALLQVGLIGLVLTYRHPARHHGA